MLKLIFAALMGIAGLYLVFTPSGKGFYKQGDKKMEPGIRAAGGVMAICAVVYFLTRLLG